MIGHVGFTLSELIVVIAVLGLVAGTAAVALSTAFGSPTSSEADLARARTLAIVEGRPRRLQRRDSSGVWIETVLVLPDGRVVGGGVDPLTGGRSAE
jgi:prepilin-type N-terminal cleavage/methylation domain-containing protein